MGLAIPSRGPKVDEFFLTVPCLIFNMCMIFTQAFTLQTKKHLH